MLTRQQLLSQLMAALTGMVLPGEGGPCHLPGWEWQARQLLRGEVQTQVRSQLWCSQPWWPRLVTTPLGSWVRVGAGLTSCLLGPGEAEGPPQQTPTRLTQHPRKSCGTGNCL